METPECLTPDEQQAMQNELNGRCRDCRWWQHNRDNTGRGWCILIDTEADRERGKQIHPLALAWTVSEGDPYANIWLETQPEFGCVQWKAKDPA